MSWWKEQKGTSAKYHAEPKEKFFLESYGYAARGDTRAARVRALTDIAVSQTAVYAQVGNRTFLDGLEAAILQLIDWEIQEERAE
jgi:hypothetical protein